MTTLRLTSNLCKTRQDPIAESTVVETTGLNPPFRIHRSEHIAVYAPSTPPFGWPLLLARSSTIKTSVKSVLKAGPSYRAL
jgi:hypothetical protein